MEMVLLVMIMRNRPVFGLPIINQSAVKDYLLRDLDNHDYLKTVPKEELYDHANELGYRFVTECWHNQLVCFALGTTFNEFCFFAKMGGGKSKISLDLIRYRARRGELLRALVLVPELLHVSAWEDQIKEHSPDLTYQLLLGNKSERFDLIDKKSDICVMNYKGLETYMSRLVSVRNKKKKKQQIDPIIASEFVSRFNFVVYDEAHRLGNHRSLLYKMCSWISSSVDYRYVLTGTPFGRDPEKLWPQFMLIDHGKTLGRTLGLFRSVFFTPKKDYWSGIDWCFNQSMTGELHRIIKHRSITYELSELRDMPKKIPIRLPVRLSKEGRAYYSRIIAGLIEAQGDYSSLGNIFVRMRQCASGFLALKADDETRVEIQFKENPKLDALREFILSKEDKVLVFHEFIHSGKLIEQMLTQSKVGFASLRGGTKDPAAQYQKFLTDKKCQVFVLNNRLGSESINPQYITRRAVFYESPISPIQREQAEGRVHRPGQKWTTFIYDLMVLGTIEEKIKVYLKEGHDLLKAVLSGDESLINEEEDNV